MTVKSVAAVVLEYRLSGGEPNTMQEEHVEHYKNGNVKGKGLVVDGKMEGYWEWFRKDGTKMRSGHFKAGEQVGEWITYDQQGQVYKVTSMDKKSRLRS